MSTDLHTLSGAYALDALSPEEAAEFRKHLAGCPACRDEVRELREAAATMGASEATAPSAELRAKVLTAADATSQLPPKVIPSSTSAQRRWTPRLLAAAAAVVVAVAAGIGISQLERDDQTLAAPVVAVFEAPDAQTRSVRTANGGTLVVAASQELGRMAVDTDELPALADQQVYQLWAIHDGQPAPAGLLEDPDAGAAMALPARGDEVAITIEPAGGSTAPTTDPIAVVDPNAI